MKSFPHLQIKRIMPADEAIRNYRKLADSFNDDWLRGEKPAAYQLRVHEQLLAIDGAHRRIWALNPSYAAYTAPEALSCRMLEWKNSETGQWELVELASHHQRIDSLTLRSQALLKRWNEEEVTASFEEVRMPRPYSPKEPQIESWPTEDGWAVGYTYNPQDWNGS